jgi:hypothetical protein
MRKTLSPTGLVAISAAIFCGVVAFVDFVIPNPQIDAVGAILMDGVAILAAFALLLGILNILAAHARRVVSGDHGRGLSLLLILTLCLTLTLGVLWPGSRGVRWVFDHVYFPLQSTMAALLAFFIVNAAVRVFRLRHVEALILLVTSLFLLLAQLPFSNGISPYLPLIRDWIMAVPVTAAMRGMILGIALGIISTSLRILLAMDRPYLGE